jgi:phage tail sheath protein FI
MSDYFHGIRVVDKTTLSPSITAKSSSVIALLGTVKEKPSDFKDALPYLVNNLSTAKSFVGGSVGDALQGIYLQAQAQVVVCGVTKPEEIKNAADALLNIKQSLDLDLGFIIAPDVDASLLASLKKINDQTKSVLLVDLPEKSSTSDPKKEESQDALLKSLGSERVMACYPKVLVLQEDGKSKPYPLSAFLAGVFARTDEEKGFWYSPSNQRMNGVVGLSVPVPYIDDDPTCLANILNEKKIVTVIRDDGFRIWGNSGLYDNNTPAYRFISVVRTKDVINRSLRKSLRWAIDRGITRNLITEIIAKVQEFLAQLKLKGAIIDGTVYADDAQNTPGALVEGKIFFNIEFTPVFIAETITFTSVLTDKYLKNISG